jgi:tRNA(fMet)-specific endonuclease VapC
MYFLDANVLIHYANDERKRGLIEKRLDLVGAENVKVSAITLYELHTKLIKAKVSKQNVDRLDAIVRQFGVRNFNTAAAVSAAKVRVQLENAGKRIGEPDQLLAGHAKAEKAVVVTNNTQHLGLVHGLKIEDWIEN